MTAASLLADQSSVLEQLAYASQTVSAVFQVAVIGVAVWAGWAAYKQSSAFALFELLKYAQNEPFRLARRSVIRDISPLAEDAWWDANLELEAIASDCCAHYDVIGRVLMFRPDQRLTRFLEPWGPSIIRTYGTLRPFVEHRRAGGGPDFRGYEWLYEEAMRRRSREQVRSAKSASKAGDSAVSAPTGPISSAPAQQPAVAASAASSEAAGLWTAIPPPTASTTTTVP